MTPLDYLFAKILDNACVSYDLTEGFSSYRVGTHCVEWSITARKTDGVWEVKDYWVNPMESC